ncbi:peptide chain release factor N(5)-glutamine methyltransferase [Pseudorhodobacter ferrugineus]|uniref:peptide chain release factor N(5)-glutamine methyltransferase n=1 Tax=Pseudorhodobacter ferrugineus TaxID=77008 RepID=UPI0003B60D8C|nr:peptide chain release factor N(5)-glutamine methyltransferase [Pseudorhodobacter ferrugineus]
MTTLLVARRTAVAQLRAAEVPDAAQDAAVLLGFVLGVSRADLALMPAQTVLTGAQVDALAAAVSARATRRPVSHITGQRLFWGRSFAVTPDVLDPRPETESLIAAALTLPFSSVLDLGTGSGCILLTLLAERAGAVGLGVDLSGAALDVARRNAASLGVQASFSLGSWFAPVEGQFDLIVSNPPYIAAGEMAGLSPEVRLHEPHLALTPGGDGLDAYRIICAEAPAYLANGGRLLVEIGPTQGAAVAGFFKAAGFARIEILPDLDGRDRVVSGQFFGT